MSRAAGLPQTAISCDATRVDPHDASRDSNWDSRNRLPGDAKASKHDAPADCGALGLQDEQKGKRVWELSEKLCGISAATPSKKKEMATA